MLRLLLFIILISFFTNAQQAIIPIENERNYNGALIDTSEGIYFKDVNNVLDKFVGTWKYDDGNGTVYEITFYKVLHYTDGDDVDSYDQLRANFKLSLGGIEQFNTYTNPCDDCIWYTSGFYIKFNYNQAAGHWEQTPANANMYELSYMEPGFNFRESSMTYIIYSTSGSQEVLTWERQYDQPIDYVTGLPVDVYKTPEHMTLIKQ
jgi:hypothetical protein